MWELMRLPYNAVCILGAWFGWGMSNAFGVALDDQMPACISDSGALWNLCLGFVVLNMAYSLVYAAEFVLLARSSQAWNRGVRAALFVGGCILGLLAATGGANSIADGIRAEKSWTVRARKNIEEMRKKEDAWNEAREKASRNRLPTLADFASKYPQAVKQVSVRLRAEGEEPSEFYVYAVAEESGDILNFQLVHKDTYLLMLENQNFLGNPSGKDRSIRYNTNTGIASQSLFSQ